MQPEQAMVFADDDSPVFMGAIGDIMAAILLDEPKVTEAFKSGKGVGWNERAECLFCGTARFFRTGLQASSGAGMAARARRRGGQARTRRQGRRCRLRPRRLDAADGQGLSRIRTSSASTTIAGSIEPRASGRSKRGLGERVTFAVATAKTYPANDYDLVCFFDCLHDMGDPVGALSHVRETLAKDGTCMLVEPFAQRQLEDNLNPVGRLFYAASTMVCTPASLAQEVGLALGAQAGEARLREVAKAAGFSSPPRRGNTVQSGAGGAESESVDRLSACGPRPVAFSSEVDTSSREEDVPNNNLAASLLIQSEAERL